MRRRRFFRFFARGLLAMTPVALAGADAPQRPRVSEPNAEMFRTMRPWRQTDPERAAGVTPVDYSYEPPTTSLMRYGGDPTGAADSTAAIQAAINVAQKMPNGGVVLLGRGTYKVTRTLRISSERIQVIGEGRGATRIVFAPAANDVLFEFHAGGAALVRCSLRGLTIFSDDSTHTKTAIDLYDTEEFILDDVEIGGGVIVGRARCWSGAGSIGLRTRGRQLGCINNVQVSADRPILISVNPNSSIDIDHFDFSNLYLMGNGHPLVEIETGVKLSDVSFRGKQAWVRGTYGLYWVDTTSNGQSFMLDLENVRWEQGTDSKAYLVRIEQNTALVGLKLHKCFGGADRNGYYFRKVSNLYFDTVIYTGTGVALDANATCRAISGRNCFWQSGSTAALAGQRLVFGAPQNPSGGLRPDFIYDQASNADATAVTESALMGVSTTIAADATAAIGPNVLRGLLFVVTDENASAIYNLRGPANATTEIADPDGVFSITAGTASSYNICQIGGKYVIQNKRGGSHKVRWMLLGTHSV